jgi:hypothetical protein
MMVKQAEHVFINNHTEHVFINNHTATRSPFFALSVSLPQKVFRFDFSPFLSKCACSVPHSFLLDKSWGCHVIRCMFVSPLESLGKNGWIPESGYIFSPSAQNNEFPIFGQSNKNTIFLQRLGIYERTEPNLYFYSPLRS